MKRLALLALVVALAIPATAEASVNRQIATQCFQGEIWSQRFNPIVQWNTHVPCSGYVPDLSKPWYTVGRPSTDLYGADRAASHFWPGCSHVWYASDDKRAQTGFYYTFFTITC